MADETKGKRGRKTLLNETLIEQITGIISAGNYFDDAARYVGIAERTFYLWMTRGRQALEEANDDIDNVSPTELIYVQFMQAVERARSVAMVRNMALIQKAADKNWQAAAWYLERTSPQKFGRLNRTEISGPEGQPLEVNVDAKKTLLAKLGLDDSDV